MSDSAVGELVGRVIGPGGRYRLLAVLGKGGMATVYQAEQLNVPRQVAIKVADPGLARLPTFARRFQQEVGALARLEHGPGILPVYDVGDEEGLLYLVMPLVTGGTLKDRLERGAGQPWPPRQALPLVQQVLDGLEFAHERGFIHRDVKPSNILLEGERVYLSDFGIAKLLQEGSDQTQLATLTGVALMGTPAYMAPEQALGLPADRRADVYAFGVVLYEVLTGRVPYQALTPMQLAFKHVEAALPPPRSLNPTLDPRLEAVLLRALARQPEHRFPTAKVFNEAYQQAVDEAYPAPRRAPTPLPAAGAPAPPDGTPSATPSATPAATLPEDAAREASVQAFSAELFRRLERVKSQRAEWGKAEELNRAALLREAELARLRQEQEARARAEREARERAEREQQEQEARARAEQEERERQERERLAQAEVDRQREQQEQEARAALLREQRAREERERTERERRQREERERAAAAAAAAAAALRAPAGVGASTAPPAGVPPSPLSGTPGGPARRTALLPRVERRELLRAGATAGVAVGAGALLWLLWPKGQVPNGNGYTGTATPGQATPTVRPGPTVAGPVAPLSQPRAGHSAIVLRNGLLLVAGGLGPERGYLSSTELFDPAANRWTAGGPLSRARAGHTATLLSDGTVLVAGGQDSDATYLASAELFDPETRRWTSVEPMSSTRSDHTAIRLANGRVLVVGGQNEALWHATAEAYDPATRRWAPAGRLAGVRANHAAAPLPDGKVLVAGGSDTTLPLTLVELYDPTSNQWAAGPALSAGRIAPLLTSLAGGQLLMTGGVGFVRQDYGLVTLALPATERLDSGTGQWVAGAEMAEGRVLHTATLLPGGQVLVVGGQKGDGTALASAERFDPATGAWTATPPLSRARASHTAVLLPGGQVLVAGGQDGAGRIAGVEVYDPATNRWSASP